MVISTMVIIKMIKFKDLEDITTKMVIFTMVSFSTDSNNLIKHNITLQLKIHDIKSF